MNRKQLIFIVRAVLTILILTLIFRAIGWQNIRPALADMRIQWVLLMYLVTLCVIICNASLTRFLLLRIRLRVTLGRVVLANALSTFYTLILPSDVLAGIAKWVDLSAATGDKPGVLSVMVFAKIALALPPLVIGAVALALQNPLDSIQLPIAAALLTIALIAATALLLNPASGKLIDGLVLRASRVLPEFLQTRIRSLLMAVGNFRELCLADHLLVYALSVCTYVLGIGGFACAAAAAGVSVPVTTLLWVSMVLFVTRLLPITLSNLGVREGIIVASFALFGVAPAPALLVGVIMFTNTLVVAFFGALYQVAVANGWVDWKPEHSR